MTVELQDAIVAALGVLIGGGGAVGYGRVRGQGRDEAAIRREAKLEAAVENLLQATEALRKKTHDLANTVTEHGHRLEMLERDLGRIESGPIDVDDRDTGPRRSVRR